MTKNRLLFSAKNQKETEICRQILEAVNYYGFFWRNNTGQRGGVRFGLPGSADIIGVSCGLFIAIEVKRPGECQSEDQITFENNVKRRGRGYYFVASSVEQAVKGVLYIMEKSAKYRELLHELKQLTNGIVDEGREEIIAILKELVKRHELDISEDAGARNIPPVASGD